MLFITTCSELRKVLFLAPSVCGFLFVYEISPEPLNGSATNSHGKREFEGQGHLGQKWHFSAIFGSLRAVCLVKHL